MTAATAVPLRQVEHCMGTVFSIDVRAPGVHPGAVREAVDWLHWVDATFSTYKPDSQISRLRAGTIGLRDCATEVAEVLDQCAALGEATGGYFDCRYGGQLDPSGYVKGWAIERVSDMLAAAGSVSHCVNGGGDVQCIGSPAPGGLWHIGIADPRHPGRVIASVPGNRVAVATSGTAERGLHIVDPHTGVAPSVFASISVVGSRLAGVDAYATAAFAMGADAVHWLEAERLTALLVRPDGEVVSTGHG
jgi:thiamine biosynthesis lipoprotein